MPEHDESDLLTGAKAAAAAAAVGAAVGVARAIAARAERSAKRDEPEPQTGENDEDHEEPETQTAEQDERPLLHLQGDDGEEPEREEASDEPRRRVAPEELRSLTQLARDLLGELSGVDVESVSAVNRTADGWQITLEAVEVRRIPDTADVLATYDLELDDDGDLLGYERRRRYARAQSDHGDRA